MTDFGTREREQERGYGTMLWSFGICVGSVAVLLFLHLAPRPFLTTIAAILWLVALMGAAAMLHIRQSRASVDHMVRLAWRIGGAPYIIGAAILIADPLLGKGELAIPLAILLGVSGLARLSLGLGERRWDHAWLFLSGAVTIAIAMAIGFAWPFAAIGSAIMALAMDLLILGGSLIFTEIAEASRRAREG